MKKRITDRAKRYRAQKSVAQRKRACIYCAKNPAKLDVEHINGDEGDSRPDNLALACRPCNVLKGRAFAKAGIGIRTVQSNPDRGARTAGQWQRAVDVLLGYARGSLLNSVALVRATPVDKRVDLARAARAFKPNPGGKGAQSLGQWVAALQRAKEAKASGRENKAVRKLIEDTPASRRSDFNRAVWRIRHERYGRADEKVPF